METERCRNHFLERQVPLDELNQYYPADDALRRALIEAERAGCLKSEFLDRISHRVRTAIQTVRGMSDLLRQTGLSVEQEGYLQNIDNSVENLFGVVGEVVDFSKIEAASLAFAEEDFYLKEALDQELYMLHQSARNKSLNFTCVIDKDVPEAMSGDASRLAQALLAVAGNAVRYTERGGVDIEVMNGGYHSDGRIFITFSVHDSGPGLSQQQLRALRRLLAEPPSPHLTIPEGLGLGLAVACRLTQLSQGRMTVASDERGTTFALSLPFREIPVGDDDDGPEEDASFFEEPSPLFALNGAKILVAEDDPINGLLMATVIRQAGAEVHIVSSGQAALTAMRTEAFDAVLMDVGLPEMDGLEAARHIRLLEKESGRPRCPIVALTAHAQNNRGACLRAGIDEYCVKPINKDELLTKLGNHLTPSVLVVVSDSGGQQDMLRFLVEKGFRVTLAKTARAALYEAALSHFGLILLDIHFLREDSLEITKVIRQLEAYTGRRALIIGVGGDDEAREGCLIGGIDGCLRWPFSGDEFTALLARLSHFGKA